MIKYQCFNYKFIFFFSQNTSQHPAAPCPCCTIAPDQIFRIYEIHFCVFNSSNSVSSMQNSIHRIALWHNKPYLLQYSQYLEYMIWTISILTIATIAVIIFRYYRSFKGSKDNFWSDILKWNNLSGLIQTIFVFVTLWFSIFTIIQTEKSISSSNKSTEATLKELQRITQSSDNVRTSIDDVGRSLGRLPEELDMFSKGITDLNEVLAFQGREASINIANLHQNVDDFGKAIENYKQFLDSYNERIEEIIDQTDVQLAIWKDQQKIINEEYSRRPILTVLQRKPTLTDTTISITSLIVRNLGNITGNVKTLSILINKDFVLDFQAPTYVLRIDTLENDDIKYQLSFSDNPSVGIDIHPGITQILENITLVARRKNYNCIKLLYRLTYSSRYQDDLSGGDLFIGSCKQ